MGSIRFCLNGKTLSLEQIKAINWERPVIEKLTGQDNEVWLPESYGFDLVKITYDSNTRSYTVTARRRGSIWAKPPAMMRGPLKQLPRYGPLCPRRAKTAHWKAPSPLPGAWKYIYGQYYLDIENNKVYLCQRTGEAAGGTVVLQYLPRELIGNYFTEQGCTHSWSRFYLEPGKVFNHLLLTCIMMGSCLKRWLQINNIDRKVAVGGLFAL